MIQRTDFHQFFTNGRNLIVDNELLFFFRSLKGRGYDNYFLGKIANATFVALAIRNGIEYRNADEWIDRADDPSTLCRNLVCFRSVITKIVTLEIVILGDDTAKIGISHQ